MKGWVYVISNKAMPGLVKVGYSMKDPELRAAELNHTGSPHPYVVDYEALVEEPREVEQKSHQLLAPKREGKEWFRCSAEEAIVAVRTIATGNIQIENFKQADRKKASALLEIKEREERQQREMAELVNKRNQALDAKCREISQAYDQALQTLLPKIEFWPYAIAAFFCILLLASYFFPNAKSNPLVVFSALAAVVSYPFFRDYRIDRAKKAEKYTDLLKKKTEELAAIDAKRNAPVFLANDHIEPVVRSLPKNECPHCGHPHGLAPSNMPFMITCAKCKRNFYRD
jgi:hypothetical protein